MHLRINSKIALTVSAIAVSFAMTPIAFAATATNFNAGHIIDDSVFTSKNSLSAPQIQDFLNSKVPDCDSDGSEPSEYGGGTRAQYAASQGVSTPFICLKDYSENGYTSAQIIYNTAQEFSVNPQVLIVLLQKEQGLVTDEWPFPSQYKTATGYGCPDTEPCDSQYYGLTNQLRWSARMFRAIINGSPDWYTPYILGNNYIKWHPDFLNQTTNKWEDRCGGTTVNIENRATQALYNYTPYQPNIAALGAGYGNGDGCSSYGNRNFYLYFSDWFGATTGPDYAASFKSAKLFTDSSKAPSSVVPYINGKYIVKPGQAIYADVEATNTGRAEWSSYSSLGTANPRDRVSLFRNDSWLSGQRVVHPTTIPVKAVEVGKFAFSMNTPTQAGGYNEAFSVVEDGKMWTSDILNLAIDATTPRPYSPSYAGHILDSSGKNTLNAGGQILSPDLYTSLSLRNDGRLALRKDFSESWVPAGAGAGSRLVMQGDGNLVLYTKDWAPVWNSGTSGKGPSKLIVQEDGNLVVYNAQGPTWSSGSGYPTSHINFTTNRMMVDGVIYPGQGLETPDRKFGLYLQGDGNLVLYSPYRALWSSGTVGTGAMSLVVQGDGNLVLYNNAGKAVWNSGTAGRGPSSLNMQGDGNLVLYNSTGPTWHTMTSGKQ